MSSSYEFQYMPGIAPRELSANLHFVGTGMLRDYDLRWMSTAPRRDFGSGISGSHFGFRFDTCIAELNLTKPYPADSYHVSLTGKLRLLDLRYVDDPTFSGAYYHADRSISCRIIEANQDYLNSGNYDGILRYSKPLLEGGQFEEVVALNPNSIGKLGVKSIIPLGDITKPLNVILPDGSSAPMIQYFPPA